jgi:hypothetical protein
MAYILIVAMAILATLSLMKDWRAHKHRWRQFSVLLTILIVMAVGIVNTYLSNKATAKREEESAKEIDGLRADLTSANEKLEFTKGQLATIAMMLRSNNTDPTVLAGIISRALHPPEKLPCLNPAYFTIKHNQSTMGYQTVIDISNPTGIQPGTNFQVFFNGRVRLLAPLDTQKVTWGGGAGDEIGSMRIDTKVAKGKTLTLVAESYDGPLDVRCVDRFEPPPQN